MVHENSLRALREDRIKLNRRETEVFGAIARMGHCTARQIRDFLERKDLNEVRPRITELKKKGLIEEAETKVRDSESEKLVSVFRIKPAKDYVPDPGKDNCFLDDQGNIKEGIDIFKPDPPKTTTPPPETLFQGNLFQQNQN